MRDDRNHWGRITVVKIEQKERRRMYMGSRAKRCM